MSKEYPKCHFCGEELGEAIAVKSNYSGKTFFVCFDCDDIIAAIARDRAAGVISDIAEVMNDQTKTWRPRRQALYVMEGERK